MSIEARVIAERLLAENDWMFTSKVEERRVSVYGRGYAEEVRSQGDAVVVWELQPEFRTWGLKSLDVIVHKVSVTVRMADTDAEGYDANVRTMEVVYDASAAVVKHPAEADYKEMAHYLLADAPFKLRVSRHTPESSNDSSIFPTEITVDLNKRTIEVDF